MSTLTGVCVLLTRPQHQVQKLQSAIADQGGRSLSLPMLAIDPVSISGCSSHDSRSAALGRQMMSLDQYQIFIFVSSNAASFGLDWVEHYWPQFPLGIEIVAIGPSTAAVLAERLTLPINESCTAMTSEALLAVPQLQEVAGRKIAIFRGSGGRELLARTLRERGAQVDYIEVYDRRAISYEPGVVMKCCSQAGVNAISVLSVETLESLLASIESKAQQAVQQLPLLAPSARVADNARQRGFHWVIDCQGADSQATIAGLMSIADKLTKHD